MPTTRAAIFGAQLCDAPAHLSDDEYLRRAMGDRLYPGDGELPVRAFMAALPEAMTCAIEAPFLAEQDLLARAKRGLAAGRAADAA